MTAAAEFVRALPLAPPHIADAQTMIPYAIDALQRAADAHYAEEFIDAVRAALFFIGAAESRMKMRSAADAFGKF